MTLKDILGEPISRDEALDIIMQSETAYYKFCKLSNKNQEDILAFVQGNKGLPILYDGFYKHVLDPERNPERLEGFLTELFGQTVVIERVLAKEGTKLVDEGSLVVMDIIVRLSDGSIIDVEMQKFGYLFTGERSSCYVSDMIMRQYNRIKSEKRKDFKFKDMKPVYLVILMEKSTIEFKRVSPNYIHQLRQSFDTGVELNLLSNLTYISLDTFKEVRENINNKMDAWLTFLSSDEPEELINMFSDALLQMDKNTVRYMIEEQQNTIEEQQKALDAADDKLRERDILLRDQAARIAELEAALRNK